MIDIEEKVAGYFAILLIFLGLVFFLAMITLVFLAIVWLYGVITGDTGPCLESSTILVALHTLT